MRLLVLNYEFPPLGGGQANANYYIFTEWEKGPHQFTLITSSTHHESYTQFSHNIEIYSLDIGKDGNNLHTQSVRDLLAYTYKSYIKSTECLKKHNYDAIMCWSYPAIGVGYWLNKRYSIPYYSLLRGAETPFYEKKRYYLDTYLFQYLAPLFWKKSKAVIANSKGLKQLAQKTAPNQEISIIENGIALEEFDLQLEKNPSFFQVLFVGRLTERKGVKSLLEAWALFALGKENIRLNIVGSGEQEEELQALSNNLKITKSVCFLGKKSHNELPKIYQSNDLYILPSSNEGMSNTLLEALASRLPVIVTDVGGTKELFDENGWMIEINNPQYIASKLSLAYQAWQQGILRNMGEKSYEKVKTMSWESKAEEFLQVFLPE